MAAPTNVRVEANSTTTAILRWTDNGATVNDIYRSTDNMTFAKVDAILSGVEIFLDSDLEPATQYWYKITNDDEVSFSDVVNVITHTCVGESGGSNEFGLPLAHSVDELVAQFNNLSIQVEEVIGGLVLQPGDCLACAVNGAVVINCRDKTCKNFIIIADQNINSITVDQSCLPNSNDCGSVPISFIVPANQTAEIGGWPAGCGFDGDEGNAMSISGGAEGRTVSSNGRSKPGYGAPVSGGTGGGGSGCNCVPGNRNQLTIRCCSDNCSLNCSGAKELKIKICGGLGPYNISVSGSMTAEKENGDAIASTDDVDEGRIVVIKPPTNSGSAVSGVAYSKNINWQSCHNTSLLCDGTSGCTFCSFNGFTSNSGKANFGCNDQSLDDCGSGGGCSGPTPAPDNVDCQTVAFTECPGSGTTCVSVPDCADYNGDDLCASVKAKGRVCDARTAQMITDGCNPCGLNYNETITVTDATGTSVVETVIA